MSPLVIGIDPGKTGAAVALDLDGRPIEWIAADHPSEGYVVKGSKARHYVPSCMALWLADLIGGEVASSRIRLAVIEKQSTRPIEGRTSCLTTGIGFGLWVGILAALRVPYQIVPPATWTRGVFGSAPASGERKARAILTARARLPELELTWGRKTKAHDGIADAGCMALHALDMIGRGAA